MGEAASGSNSEPSAGKTPTVALAGWLIWLEHHPIHQMVWGSIPSQGT